MFEKKKDPGLELEEPESLIFRLFSGWKRGAEGQSRTDTGLPPAMLRPQFLRKGQNPIRQRTHARRADYRRKLALTIYAPRFPGGPRQN